MAPRYLLIEISEDLHDNNGNETTPFDAVSGALDFFQIPARIYQVTGEERAAHRVMSAAQLIRLARENLKSANCPKALERARLALSSVNGAVRNSLNREVRK